NGEPSDWIDSGPSTCSRPAFPEARGSWIRSSCGVLAWVFYSDDPNTPILRELQLLMLPQDGKRHCRAGGAIMERRLTRMCLRGFCGDLRLFRILLDKNSNAAGSL